MSKRLIRVGHSPDPDDAFMFHALAQGKIETGPYEFRHELQDIETLNRRALEGDLEVSAVSIHAYAQLGERYLLLPHGASMGDKYGPIIVARAPFSRAELPNRIVAVPGTLTTAFLAYHLYCPGAPRYTVLPFDEIISAVAEGRVDAGLIIHEGQLTYQNQKLVPIADMGQWWFEETGLPLPLGGNVIRRDLGPDVIRDVTRLLRQSIAYGLEHRHEALTAALEYARDMGRDLADRFVGMYVNHWTLDYGDRGRQAIHTLLERAHAAGIIEKRALVEFAREDS